jgi:hypothetical protein
MPLDWQTDNLTYREQGSYRFSEEQRSSMVLACSVEIVSVVREEYASLKSLPPNGHYGYAVIFHGADPVQRIDLEFPITRLFTVRNELAVGVVGQYFLASTIVESLRTHYDCLSPVAKSCADLGVGEFPPVVIPGHSETIVKVKVPAGSQFNVIVYWVPIPDVEASNVEVDGSDGSDGQDEFGKPDKNPAGNPWEGNPNESDRNPNNDPRDYADGNQGETGTWNVPIRYFDAGNNPPCDDTEIVNFVIAGYRYSYPGLEFRGETNSYGAKSGYLVTAIAEIKIAETCGAAIAGIPYFSPASQQ